MDAGEGGPIRCGRCKAYVNPFIQWLDAGRRFRCNFCAAINETPHDDIENVMPDGRRRDADERAELNCGSVEFVATSQFMVRVFLAGSGSIRVPGWQDRDICRIFASVVCVILSSS